jgi:hypothetical protein
MHSCVPSFQRFLTDFARSRAALALYAALVLTGPSGAFAADDEITFESSEAPASPTPQAAANPQAEAAAAPADETPATPTARTKPSIVPRGDDPVASFPVEGTIGTEDPTAPAPIPAPPIVPVEPAEATASGEDVILFDDGASPTATTNPLDTEAPPEAEKPGFEIDRIAKLNSYKLEYFTRFLVNTDWTEKSDLYVVDWQNYFTAGIDIKPMWNGRIVVEARARHRSVARAKTNGCVFLIDPGQDCRNEYEIQPREIFADWYTPWFDLRVGNQLFAWGFAESASPAEFLNPADLRFGLTLKPDQAKIAVPAVTLTSFPVKELELNAVFIPFFVPSKLWLFGDNNAILQPGLPFNLPITGPQAALLFSPSLIDQIQDPLKQTRLPDEAARNFQGAFRAKYNYGDGDVQAYYGYTFNSLPTFIIDRQLLSLLQTAGDIQQQNGGQLTPEALIGVLQRNPSFVQDANAVAQRSLNGEVLVDAFYQRRHTAGIGWRHLFDPVTVKIEAAYISKMGVLSRELLNYNLPVVQAVAGFDIDFAPEFVFVLEAFALVLPTRPNGVDLLLFEDRVVQPGITAAIRSSLLDDTLELQAFAYTNAYLWDVIVNGSVNYKVTDNHSVGAGANGFIAPDLAKKITPGGIFGRNTQVFVQYQYQF